ncbi:thioredoxin-like protein [Dothidotthia symphoricarpi CBS 119687]|uniref:Thioredoxin-like protein n=1 Tax=Dothidotthia symphoricarpi CBS 119687 TaxID=1392245 RepID=A0A6A6A721_9PLEO|nr:thioredoxin-like protein [Dothidotthia symphoricarpi CBS 119687]KAF2127005.1 thioredoxin-like protein [Dothidotthia symphoricarpi CBS 119687]
MPYESTITFILDTICPWTYLAFIRLNKALASYRSKNPSSPASFTLQPAPYQLYPDFSTKGEDKYEWYKKEKYGGSEERMNMYADHMTKLGNIEGISFDFHGQIGNTLHAHRIIHYLLNSKSPAAAQKCLESLYKQYFEQQAHPSRPSTLVTACLAAGLTEEEARTLVDDESEGLGVTKAAIREQTGNGVDSVPYIVFEGRRRDFTLVGAKEVAEYEKILGQVAKECV